MKKQCILLFLIFFLGCLTKNQLPEDKASVECEKGKVMIDGICCLDLNEDRICDGAAAIENLRSALKDDGGCKLHEIDDPRHPDFCCFDLDKDKKCDYLNDLK